VLRAHREGVLARELEHLRVPLQRRRHWSVDDTSTCIGLLRNVLLPACNQFGYGQVESPYGSGQFIKDIKGSFGDHPKLVTSEITSKDDIMDSIREFLKGGR
jgi:uncharacterized sporulation protein YeaH/YhbH (DUF444 family)